MVQPKVHNGMTYYCQNHSGFMFIFDALGGPNFIKVKNTKKGYNDNFIASIIATTPFIPIPPDEKFALSLYHTISFKYDELFDTEEIAVEETNNDEQTLNPLIPLTDHLTAIDNSSCKGILGKHAVVSILISKYGEDRVEVTREKGHHADILLKLDHINISIEVKNCSEYNSDQIHKFCYDLINLRINREINNLFGVIVYIQSIPPTERDANRIVNPIVNPIVNKVNSEFVNSSLLAIDFLELLSPQNMVTQAEQRMSTLSDQDIDGFKFIYEMAGNHKILVPVSKLRKYEEVLASKDNPPNFNEIVLNTHNIHKLPPHRDNFNVLYVFN